MKTEIAKALKVLQDATGCRVLLEPIMGNETPSFVAQASSESVSEPMKVEAAVKEKPTRKARKAKNEAKEAPITYMTIREFAKLKNVCYGTVLRAVTTGIIPENFVSKNDSGVSVIDSRCFNDITFGHSRKAKPVRCVETNTTYPSLGAAAKAFKISNTLVRKSVQTGIKVGGYHFKEI